MYRKHSTAHHRPGQGPTLHRAIQATQAALEAHGAERASHVVTLGRNPGSGPVGRRTCATRAGFHFAGASFPRSVGRLADRSGHAAKARASSAEWILGMRRGLTLTASVLTVTLHCQAWRCRKAARGERARACIRVLI